MKKIIVCVLGILMLSGCGKTTKTAAPITENITFDLNITYFNENYRCSCRIDKDGTIGFTLTQPEEIAGMTLNIGKTSVRIIYKGLTYTPSDGNLPLTNVCQTIYDAVKNIRETDIKPQANGENCELSGKLYGKEYIFTFSPTGYPLGLKLPSEAFTAEFSNVTLINYDGDN